MGTVRRLSIPGPGRTLLLEAEARALFLRDASRALQREANQRLGCRYDELFAEPGAAPRLASSVVEDSTLRASWGLIAVWLVGRLTNNISSSGSLQEADEWFFGESALTRCVSGTAIDAAMGSLSNLCVDSDLDELLPYVLDPVGLGTRRAVIRDQGQRSARAARKSAGVYYTPGDVVDFMLGAIGALDSNDGRLLDPACGTGVFLRAALRRASMQAGGRSAAVRRLYGIDISLWAVEHCAFVLAAEVMRDEARGSISPYETWLDIRSRLVAADALLLVPPRDSHDSALQLPWETVSGFEYVVANPPYSPLGRRLGRTDLRSRFRSLHHGWTPATNSYVPFVELMWRMAAADGQASMVVPLSVAYSSTPQIAELRAGMEDAGGEWRFAFFDRTPDALFGDDIKQRSAILIRRNSRNYSASTGPLQRWTSRNRSRLFSTISYTELTESIASGIPKLRGANDALVHSRLRGIDGRLENEWSICQRVTVAGLEDHPTELLVGGTAYNWISVFGDCRSATSGVENPSSSAVLLIEFPEVNSKWAAYAVLASRLVYWLWRVEGDGFHVTKRFIAGLPFTSSLIGSSWPLLAELGSDLWRRVSQRPILSRNGGRETVTYCPHSEAALLDEIDKELLHAADLTAAFSERLADFILENTVVDFDDPLRIRKEGRPLASWVAV